jgi:hypothetical protein
MHFSNPDVLWALVALPIPVLIHLFNLQKTERIIFANNRLLEEVVQKTNKSRQVQNLLLLLARLLAFTFLIFAFALPVFDQTESSASSSVKKTALFLDNSPSMYFSDDGNRAIEKALAIGKGMADSAPANSWFLLTAHQLSGKHTWTSPSAFKEQLMDVSPSGENRSFSLLENRLNRDLSGFETGKPGQMVLISDFQKNRYFQPENLFADSSLPVKLVNINHKSISNVWIDSAWLPEPLSLDGTENQIRFRLRYSDAIQNQKVRVQFLSATGLLSGKVFQTGNGSPVIGVMPFRMALNQQLNAWLEVEDPETRFDNRFYVSIQAPEPVRVYGLSTENGSLLKQAFSSSPLFSYAQNRPSEPDYAALEKADLLILEGLSAPGSALINRVMDKVKSGASVLLIPGSSGSFPFDFAKSMGLDVAPVSSKSKEALKINLPSKNQAFFENTFQDDPGAKIKPSLSPLIVLNGMSPILQYESSEVFAGKLDLGKGRIWAVAGPLQANAGSLVKHPLFIPMLYKIGFSSEPASLITLFYASGSEYVRFSPDSGQQSGDQTAELRHESGQKILSEVQKSGDQWMVRIPEDPALEAGFWSIFQQGKKVGTFSINRDGEESVPVFYSPEELTEVFKDKPWVKIQSVAAGDPASHLETGARQAFPIWKVCLLLAILMFTVEILLLRLKRKSVTV